MGLVKDGHVIYNGMCDIRPRFSRKKRCSDRNRGKVGAKLEGNFLIGSIGRLSYQKNYEFLIKSFPKILKVKDSAICVVIGDGPTRAKCENLINKLNLKEKIFLMGELRDGAKYVKGFDLFALSSRYEGLPVTLAECVFAGIPVLASHVGGNDEIVEEKNLYHLDNEEDFLRKFAIISRSTIPVANNAALKEVFSSETMSREYLKLFES